MNFFRIGLFFSDIRMYTELLSRADYSNLRSERERERQRQRQRQRDRDRQRQRQRQREKETETDKQIQSELKEYQRVD